MWQFLTELGTATHARAEPLLAAAIALLIAELFFPQSKYSIFSRIRGVFFYANYIVVTALAFIVFGRLWGYLGLTPLIPINLNFLSGSNSDVLRAIGGIVAPLLALQVSEFFYYWFHRLQHTSRFMWTFHAEHHAIEELSALNCNHHFTEEIFRIPFVVIPLSLLFQFEQSYVPWIWATLLGWQGLYEHSSTKLNLGWFRYVVPDNRFHRIHHSSEAKHFNKNFGSGSALWDFVFGTLHKPQPGEWPKVGLSYMREPSNLQAFMFRPFVTLRDRARREKAARQAVAQQQTSDLPLLSVPASDK